MNINIMKLLNEPLSKPVLLMYSVLSAIILFPFFFSINNTTCEPVGLYLKTPITHIQDGMLVALCPPINIYTKQATWMETSSMSPCKKHYVPFLKEIVALPGQEVLLTKKGVWVDGHYLKNSEVLSYTPNGKPVKHFPFGLYRVPKGYIWEYAPGNYAFDSRYYGFVPMTNILYGVVPVLTFNIQLRKK